MIDEPKEPPPSRSNLGISVRGDEISQHNPSIHSEYQPRLALKGGTCAVLQ